MGHPIFFLYNSCMEIFNIINRLKIFAEPDFAKWIKPFLNIKEDSEEIVLGIRVPKLRKLAKEYKDISYSLLEKLLKNNIHEARALAIFIMLIKVKKEPEKICKLYLSNLEYINNWDLIDYSAPHIVAPNVKKNVLRELADSNYLWANRVAMVSTIYFIKKGDFNLTLEFAEKFIYHPHHLMHKASGWMLREVGKKDLKTLKEFLNKFSNSMPAIMRSYAKEIL